MSPFGSATLVLQGPGGKLKYEITGERTAIGRTRDNEIVLQDPAVSSHHCELVADRAGLTLRDLNSSNGSYVNGRRVQEGPVYDGDTLKLGQFQGRIAVRNLEGKPLKAPGVAGPALIVAGVVVLVLVAGALVMGLVMHKKAAAKAAYDQEYVPKVTSYLNLEPCSAAEKGVEVLDRFAKAAGQPDLGRRGRLSKAEARQDERVYETSKKREDVVEKIVADVNASLDRQQKGLDELKKLGDELPDPAMQAGAAALTKLFAERIQAGHEFADQWKKLGGQLAEYDKLLDRLASASPRSGDKDAADQLDGWKFKVEPQELFDGCKDRFGKSQQQGLVKLAEMAP